MTAQAAFLRWRDSARRDAAEKRCKTYRPDVQLLVRVLIAGVVPANDTNRPAA